MALGGQQHKEIPLRSGAVARTPIHSLFSWAYILHFRRTFVDPKSESPANGADSGTLPRGRIHRRRLPHHGAENLAPNGVDPVHSSGYGRGRPASETGLPAWKACNTTAGLSVCAGASSASP